MSGTRSLELVNRREELARLVPLAESFAAEHGLSPQDVFAINLVLDEIVLNVIEYGYDDDREHLIRVSLQLDADLLTIEVEDDGRPFNPLDAPVPDLTLPIEERPIGGLGVRLVRSVMDTVRHRRQDHRNVLTMTKKLEIIREHR